MEPGNLFSANPERLTRQGVHPEDEGGLIRRLRTHAPRGRDTAVREIRRTRRGDDDLNPGILDPVQRIIPAAVLVPLIRRTDELHILLTRRTPHLNAHAGQICFPGGRIEAWDASAEAAALRETQEEVGLAPSRIAVTAELDPYMTRTGYRITPLVGLLDPPSAVRPAPDEVAEVFEVPLSFILTPENRQTHTRKVEGKEHAFHIFIYGGYNIWGATAGMLVNLAEVLTQPC